jgi:DNA-directed RNA polymerase specialized sigma24 family protein
MAVVIYGMPTSPLIERKTPPKNFVPKDFAEMYRHYYVYVLRLLVQQGIDYDDADDVAQTLFIKMDERGLLEKYDASLEFEGRPALFSTMLSGFVIKYALGFRKKQNIQRAREKTWIDQDTVLQRTSDENMDNANSWIDVYGPTFEEEYSTLTDAEFRSHIRSSLAKAHPGRIDTKLDYVALFDEIDHQVMLDGKYDVTKLMAKFEITRTTAHKWLEKLRIEVSKAVSGRG